MRVSRICYLVTSRLIGTTRLLGTLEYTTTTFNQLVTNLNTRLATTNTYVLLIVYNAMSSSV